MSSILNHIEVNPQETQRLIGLGYIELQQLIQNAERFHSEKQAALESKKIRIIAGGGGRKLKLSRREQIILTLGQMIILPDGSDLVDVVAGEPGPKSDITLFRENRVRFDQKQRFKGDKAYQGEDLITTPIKKTRNRELTPEQKEQNKKFSAKRILVEHRIRSVKIFRVVQERFRLNPQKYKQVILTICGLVRFRIGSLILPAEIPARSGGQN
jgi:hypothetical protein